MTSRFYILIHTSRAYRFLSLGLYNIWALPGKVIPQNRFSRNLTHFHYGTASQPDPVGPEFNRDALKDTNEKMNQFFHLNKSHSEETFEFSLAKGQLNYHTELLNSTTPSIELKANQSSQIPLTLPFSIHNNLFFILHSIATSSSYSVVCHAQCLIEAP